MERILLVRLSSLGDIIHTVPVAAALRENLPAARIDWLIDDKFSEILGAIPVIDRRVAINLRTLAGVVREIRAADYSCVVDVQGLYRSALIARATGARRIVGFSKDSLREKGARVFYSETQDPGEARHRIHKNLSLLRAFGIEHATPRFPFITEKSDMLMRIRDSLGVAAHKGFAVLCPGSSWPHKRWPAQRFGRLAFYLRERHGLATAVLRGRNEEDLAQEVTGASSGAARIAPRTSLRDVIAVMQEASIVISGDSGPMHIAAAVSTPVVALHGPTDPRQNGPWSPRDEVVSRFASCLCQYRRQCTAQSMCMEAITEQEVFAAVDRRLSTVHQSLDVAQH